MEVTVKLRLLLTSALFLLAQMPTMQAQETVDLAKITCEQLMGEKTIIEPQTIKQEEEKVDSYCFQHGKTTVMDAVKSVLGFDN
jgi:hypothetical protein